MAKFELGQTVVTRGVDEKMKSNDKFRQFVITSLNRYRTGDWGDTCDEDKQTNEDALKHGDRLLAVYKDPTADGAGSKRRDSLPQGARHGHWRIER